MISIFEDCFTENGRCREISEVTAMLTQRLHRLSLFYGKCHGVTHRVIATIQLCTHHAYICICAIERMDCIINVNYRVCHSGLSNFPLASLSFSQLFQSQHSPCISNFSRHSVDIPSILIVNVRPTDFRVILNILEPSTDTRLDGVE